MTEQMLRTSVNKSFENQLKLLESMKTYYPIINKKKKSFSKTSKV